MTVEQFWVGLRDKLMGQINVVSPTVLTESMESYAPFFRGFEPVDAKKAAQAYLRSVEGAQTGRVYRVGY
jgi:hypothetical protein